MNWETKLEILLVVSAANAIMLILILVMVLDALK
jgi:hypothetical protein